MAYISKAELQEYCMTCPIAYYAGKPVPLEAATTSTSCANIINHSIYISVKQVNDMIENASKVESAIIRPIVYHEVSHVIFTPKLLSKGVWHVCNYNEKYFKMRRNDKMDKERIDVSAVVNIFEDERIESIARDTYMGVNFYDSICRIESWTKARRPSSIAGAFFDMIRLHDFISCKFKWHSFYNRSRQLIAKWATLSTDASEMVVNDYCDDVFDLYYDFVEAALESGEFDKMPQHQAEDDEDEESDSQSRDQNDDDGLQQQADKSDEDASDEDIDIRNPDPYQEEFDDDLDDESDAQDGQGDSDANEDEESDQKANAEANANDEGKQSEDDDVEKLGDTAIKSKSVDMMRELFKQEIFDKQDEQVKRLLSQKFFIKDMHGQQMGAMHKHSGKLDVKAVGRKDWKIFKQPSMFTDGSKIGKKLHLIVVLDQSGSYAHNDYATNLILASLISAEEHIKSFEFTLVKFGNSYSICKKNERFSHSGEGTIFSSDLFRAIDGCKKQDCANFIIFLNDGAAWTNSWRDDKKTIMPFMKKVLDHNNCVCILDSEAHQDWFRSFKAAKVIVTDDYVSKLSNNVCEALGAMLAV